MNLMLVIWLVLAVFHVEHSGRYFCARRVVSSFANMTTKKQTTVPHPATATVTVGKGVPTAAPVQTGLEAAQADMITVLGRQIITAVGEVAGKFLQLCLYIREHKVAPKLVSVQLTGLGFKRSRISEINRVSQASDDTFKQYEAKMIGFDRCLELSRFEKGGKIPVATPAAGLLAERGVMTQDELDSAIKDENTPASASGNASPKATIGAQIKSRAQWICKHAVREATFRYSDCNWVVRIEKVKTAVPEKKD